MNAKLEVLYMEFPSGGSGPYIILRRWSLAEESSVSDVIVEWGEISSGDVPVERHLLPLDAYSSDNELIAIAKGKLPDIGHFPFPKKEP